jgi:hypothetical protein
MSRSTVGLLVAVGTAMSVLAGLIHGYLESLPMAGASVASGLAAYLALPSKKFGMVTEEHAEPMF